MSAARGTSIIVPIVYATFWPVCVDDLVGDVVGVASRRQRELASRAPTSGIMISGIDLDASRARTLAAPPR